MLIEPNKYVFYCSEAIIRNAYFVLNYLLFYQ